MLKSIPLFWGVISGVLVASAVSVHSQSLTVTTLAGTAQGGSADGLGSLAQFNGPSGVAVDSADNIFVADTGNHTIRKITPEGMVSTLAGQSGYGGISDGSGTNAQFMNPSGIAVDNAGSLYVADTGNHTIRKITPEGMVSTLAGMAGSFGSDDGTGSGARFSSPSGIAVDGAGTVYVADTSNHTIRKITPEGMVSTLAGLARNAGSSDGTGTGARFYYPSGIAVDRAGTVYVADGYAIRKITPEGVVSTLAGSAYSSGSVDGTGGLARFRKPSGVVADSLGGVYVADTQNHTIRKITPDGSVSTVAGSAGASGNLDGTGNTARFNLLRSLAVDRRGVFYVADTGNNCIRKGVLPPTLIARPESATISLGDPFVFSVTAIGTYSLSYQWLKNGLGLSGATNATLVLTNTTADAAGLYEVVVSSTLGSITSAPPAVLTLNPALRIVTIAGEASNGSADGPAGAARFFYPSGSAVDGNGNVYVADTANHLIRKISPAGVVSTLAGLAGSRGSIDGKVSGARFSYPSGVAVDSGNNVYVADGGNHTIRRITSEGVTSTLAGLAGNRGSSDGNGSDARFRNPSGIALDSSGILYVADTDNHTIRKITPDGMVSTLAGLAGKVGSSDDYRSNARFFSPAGVAADSAGNVYVTDSANYLIRKISPTGSVSTLAGQTGNQGTNDGTGSDARFDYLSGIAVDETGTVYVADTGNHTIRKITSDGLVSTCAGLAGSWGSKNGPRNSAQFNAPCGIALDRLGNILVADKANHALRKIAPDGVVGTLAGNGGGDGGAGSNIQFWHPSGIATDRAGTVYLADTANHTIRKIALDGKVSILAGLYRNWGTNDGRASDARFDSPSGLAVDQAANVFVADTVNHTIRKITPDGVVSTLAGLAGSVSNNNGFGSSARFNTPMGVAIDTAGTVYVADTGNHTIRMITPEGLVSDFAGLPGSIGTNDGIGSQARFWHPSAVAVDSAGNVFVADTWNETVRKISPDGTVNTLAGLARSWGSADGMGGDARFSSPLGVSVDGAGNVYVADAGNHLIRKIMPLGLVATVAGFAASGGNADGVWNSARLQNPSGIAVDIWGNLYVTDTSNHTVRKEILEAIPNSPGIVRQPIDQTVTAGATVSFHVTAYGMEPLTYQWQKDGLALSDATNTTLSLAHVLRPDTGAYAVAVSNAVGSLLSSNAALLVKSPQHLAWSLPSGGGPRQLGFQDAAGAGAPPNYASIFVVEASTNLLDWLPLPGSFSLTNGWLLFNPNAAAYWPQRFYRVMEQ